MAGNQVTREEFNAHIEPLKKDVSQMSDYMKSHSESMQLMRSDLLVMASEIKSMQEMQGLTITSLSRDIASLNEHKTETRTYWNIIKWIGGPTVVSVWLSLIGFVISRLTAQ